MSDTAIDAGWFFERGYLHDAEVTAACMVADNVEVQIDDEWANERGLSKPKDERLPVILSFISAVVSKEMSQRRREGGSANSYHKKADDIDRVQGSRYVSHSGQQGHCAGESVAARAPNTLETRHCRSVYPRTSALTTEASPFFRGVICPERQRAGSAYARGLPAFRWASTPRSPSCRC